MGLCVACDAVFSHLSSQTQCVRRLYCAYTQYCLEPTGNWRGCPARLPFCVLVHGLCTRTAHTHFAQAGAKQGQARVSGRRLCV